jgi:hypothetical protein
VGIVDVGGWCTDLLVGVLRNMLVRLKSDATPVGSGFSRIFK